MMKTGKTIIFLISLTLAAISCNKEISRTERGVEAPAGREAQENIDPRRVPAPAHPETGPWTGTTPETAPGGY